MLTSELSALVMVEYHTVPFFPTFYWHIFYPKNIIKQNFESPMIFK